MGRNPGTNAAAEPPPQQGGLLRGILPILGPADSGRVVAHALLSLIAALAGSVAALVLVPLIQPGQLPMFGGRPLEMPTDRDTLALILAASIGSYALLRWFTAGLAACVVGGCGVRLRDQAHARLVDSDLVSLTESTSAEIANVLTQNVQLITQGVAALLQLLLTSLTTAVSLAIAFWVSPMLALTLPVLAIVGLLASRCFGRELASVNRRYVTDMTWLFRLSEDLPHRLRHVRSFEREDAEKADYAAASASLGRGYVRQVELVAAGKLLMELFAALAMAGVFMAAGHWSGIDQASLIAVGLLLGRLLPYLASTRGNFQQLHLASPALELWRRYAQLGQVCDQLAPMDIGTTVPRLHIDLLKVALPQSPPCIVNLGLAPGEMTLITGDSGVGKSSLVDVLAGMSRPASFRARVEGRQVDFDVYRHLVRKGAYISQGIRPWQRTVRECLHWVVPQAPDELLHRILVQVGFIERLASADDSLDRELQGPSGRLSGGELQRLLLAQVVLRQPFLAVLDEATCALDADSEIRVLATLKLSLPQTILVVVSHRPGLVAIADQCLHIGKHGATTVMRTECVEA